MRTRHGNLRLILVTVVSLQLVLGASWQQVLGQCSGGSCAVAVGPCIGGGGNCPKTIPDMPGPDQPLYNCFGGDHFCTVTNCPPEYKPTGLIKRNAMEKAQGQAWVYTAKSGPFWVPVTQGGDTWLVPQKTVTWAMYVAFPCKGGCGGVWWAPCVSVDPADDQYPDDPTGAIRFGKCVRVADQETPGVMYTMEHLPGHWCFCAADPVLLPSGVYLEQATDLGVPYLGGVFEVYRRYSSDSGANDVLGRGWQSALHKSISVEGNLNATVHTLHWVPATFTFDSVAGTYTAPAGSFEKLERVDGDYILTFKDGGTWYFDGTNYVRTKSADANGNEVLYQYDVDGVLTGMTDPGSRQYALLYDTGGRLTKVTDVGGRSVTYEYDASDLLTKVTVPGGAYTAYSYYPSGDAQYKMYTRTYSGMTGANMTNWYDAEGRVTRQTLGSGDFTLAYDAENVVTQTDRDGNRQIFFFTENNLQTRQLVQTNRGVREGEGDYEGTFVYDDNYLLVTRVVPSGSYERGYHDEVGNETRRTIAGASQSLSAAYWYDADSNRISLESPRGYKQQYKYDGSRNLTKATMPTVTLGQPSAQTVEYEYKYDAHGLTTREVGPGGMVTAYLYDGNGYPTKVIRDEGGLNVAAQMKYDAIGNVTESISAQGSKVWSYYDAAGRLTKQAQILDNSDPSKQYATAYWYNETGLLASKKVDHKDQDGAALSPATYLSSYLYDLEGRVTRATYQVDANNTLTTSTWYDAEGLITRTVGPNGTGAEYTYDERNTVYERRCEGCGSSVLTVDSNATGWVTKAVDGNGNVALQYYDELDRMTRKSHYDSESPPNMLSYEELEYDANDNVTRSTIRDASDAAVHRSTSLYDELDRLYEARTWANPSGSAGDNDVRTVYLYDAGSRVTKVKRYLSGTDASPTLAETSSYYDSAGRLTRAVDAEGGATSYYYATSGQLTKQTDAEGRDTTYAYDLLGRATRVTDALGRYAVTQYDSSGNVLTSISYSSGGTALAKAAYDYDGSGRVTKSRGFASPAGAADDGKDSVVSTYYDAAGLVTKTLAPNGSESTALYDELNMVTCRRDALGNRAEHVYDDNNNVITTVTYEIEQVNGSTKSFTTAMLYDGLNHLTKVVNQGADGDISQSADNGVAVYEYDALGRQTRVTDAESVSTDSRYDALGQLTRAVEDVGGLARNTDPAYDRAGRLTKLIDTLGQSTAYVYDKRGRTTRATYADHDASPDTVDLSYTAGGLVTKRVDQRGISTVYLYDGLGELTKKQDDVSSPTIVEEYGYDSAGRMTAALLSRGGNAQADVRQYYDGLGRLTRESQAIKAGTARTIDSLYDKAGSRTRLTYPAGKEVLFTYDALGRVSAIADGTNERAVYKYIGSSRLSQKALKNGANTVSTLKVGYDGLGRITSWLYRNAADDATIVGFSHDYDKVGNPRYEVRVHQGNYGDEYSYDKLYRLTRDVYDDSTPTTPTADPAASAKDDFLYDLAGNRTKAYLKSDTATTYLHDPVNELTKVDNTAYEYDAAGNLTKDGTYSYYWDYENRLTKVKLLSDSSDVAEYTYDALGRRAEKIDHTGQSAVTTQYFLDAWSVIEERDGDGTLEAAYINGPRIDEYLVMVRGGDTHWYSQSPIVGNVAALLDNTGALKEGYTYRPYGSPTIRTGAGEDETWFTADDPTATSSALGNPYLFTGRDWAGESGLYYYRARYYSSANGRFFSRDPVGYQDSMDLYEYTHGRPVSMTDPTGQVAAVAAAAALAVCAVPWYIYARTHYGDKSDKWRHCWTSCSIAKTCSTGVSVLAGLGKEARDAVMDALVKAGVISDAWAGGGFWDSMGDIEANEMGYMCAGPEALIPIVSLGSFLWRESCNCCCSKLYAE